MRKYQVRFRGGITEKELCYLAGILPDISEIQDDEEKTKALDTVISEAQNIASIFTSATINHYNQFSNLDNSLVEGSDRIVAIKAIHEMLEVALKKHFSTDSARLVNVLKTENSYLSDNWKFFNAKYRTEEKKRLTEEIKTKDSSYIAPNTGGGCYIATCVYKSYDCPQVWVLRRYRDFRLSKIWYGRTFVRVYYTISPTIVKWFGKYDWFHKVFKHPLDKVVAKLKASGYEDSPYNDTAR